jgi:hypothetical protein
MRILGYILEAAVEKLLNTATVAERPGILVSVIIRAVFCASISRICVIDFSRDFLETLNRLHTVPQEKTPHDNPQNDED